MGKLHLTTKMLAFCCKALCIITTTSLAAIQIGNSQCNPGTLSGTVFHDTNNNGTMEASEIGVGNALVVVTDPSGATQQIFSNSNGSYQFTGLTSSQYRVEFINPPGYNSSWMGSNNNSNIQFVTVPDCTVSFGVLAGNSICGSNPDIMVTCFVEGRLGDNSGIETIVGLEHNFNSNSNVAVYATKAETGSVWGLTWKNSTQEIFSSAFVKQYAGLTTHGHDAIFSTTGTAGSYTTSLFTNLSSLGINTGTLSVTDPYDCAYGDQVGKVGLGALIMSPDEQHLFVTNLSNNSVVKIDATNPTAASTSEFMVPDPGCAGGSYRVFALTEENGRIYVGVTCTADMSLNAAQSSANVFEMDPVTGAFNLIFTTNYIKGYWENNLPGSHSITHWLTDIDFTDDGNMLLGLTDRKGHRYCDGLSGRVDQQYPDLLMVWNNNGTWTLEANGSAGSLAGTGIGNGQGPSNGEFFGDEFWPTNPGYHPETALGSFMVLPGTNEVVSANYDPLINSYSGGLHRYNTQNGSIVSAIELYTHSVSPQYGKATGFGDIVAMCGPAELEIGNFVWSDLDSDGVQDAGEPALSNVDIFLYDGSFTQIASTSTDVNGNYIFNMGINPNDCYYVGLDPSIFNGTTNSYTINGSNYYITLNNTNNLVTNSDLVLHPNGTYLIEVKTGNYGDTDHNFDIGLVLPNSFDLALKKDLVTSGTPQMGDVIQFRITVSNEGNLTANNFTVSDFIGNGFTFDPNLNPGWTINGGTIYYADNMVLLPGQSRDYLVNLGLIYGNQYSYLNIAEISEAEDENGDTDSDIDSDPDDDMGNDPAGEDDIDEAPVKILDLALRNELRGNTIIHQAGDCVYFDMTIVNQGNTVAENIAVVNYLTTDLIFDPVYNVDWTYQVGIGYINTNIPSLQPGQSFVVDIKYCVDPNRTTGQIINYAEIAAAGAENCPGAQDYDSDPDNDNTNDAGGVAGSAEDNDLSGDGTVDEDDHDPAHLQLEYVDLALDKKTAKRNVLPGDLVTYTITIYNQGTITTNNIMVVDYIPQFTTLADNNWTVDLNADPNGMTVYQMVNLAGGLLPGNSTTVTITIRVDDNITPRTIINYAEIGGVTDEAGNDISDDDIDSDPDMDGNNDNGGVADSSTDDEVNDDGTTDEDDHDPALVYFVIAGTDDCMCLNNATDATDGQFSNNIIVTAPSGQVWLVDTLVNFYDAASPAPPAAPLPIAPGFTLIEVPVGGGISDYILAGVHIDNIPYFGRFTNNFGDVYEVNGDACVYDTPVITGTTAVCEGQTVTYSIPDEPGCTYVWSVTGDGTHIPSPTTPWLFTVEWGTTPGPGNIVELITSCPGECISPSAIDVSIGTTGGQISCISNLNMSLNEICELVVTPDMLIAGDPIANAAYEVILMLPDGTMIPFATLTDAHLGIPITAKLFDACSGNTCWSTITVEDKMAPMIDCADATMPCHKVATYTPLVTENCGTFELVMLNEVVTPLFCDSLYIKEVVRTYKATDSNGNESGECSQTILVERIDLDSIVFPDDFLVSNMTTLQCETFDLDGDGYPDTDITGVPTIEGIPLWPDFNFYCNLGVTFNDTSIPVIGCHQKFMREWIVYEDWCSSGVVVRDTQIIEIEDLIAPVIVCPMDMQVTTSGSTCEAIVNLPAITAIDDCSDAVTVDIAYPGGFFNNQNGGLINLPPGVHIITYTVTDACLNSSSCSMSIEVIDNTSPVVICDESLVVSLNSAGFADVYALVFDAGSFDDCYIDSIAVRRMDAGAPCGLNQVDFAPYVTFCCADIGTDVAVILGVWDKQGNYNECMVMVEVQDKFPPVIVCPADMTIYCEDSYDLSDLSEFGEAVVADACGYTLSESASMNIDNCNVGTITRTFTATDSQGTSSCTQTITVENPDPFNPATDITWPLDYEVIDMCNADLEPEDLPAGFDQPIISEGFCDMVSATYSDELFSFDDGGNACMKLLRTWSVTDGCDPNGTVTIYEQAIKILNTIEPVITSNCDPVWVCTYDETCSDGFVELNAKATDDCTDDDDLVWTAAIDYYSDGTIEIEMGMQGNCATASGMYPIGSHTVLWTFEDMCGNKVSCLQEFKIVNCVAPTAVCVNGLSTGLQCMDLDQDGEVDTEMACIWASEFNASSMHPCYDNLVYSFSPDTSDTKLTVDCDDLGDLSVDMWVTVLDENGDIIFDHDGNALQSFCTTFIEVQDNNDCDLCDNFDLALAKTYNAAATPQPISSGGNVVFDIMVCNQGDNPVTSVEVTDYIPSGFTLNDTDWTAGSAGSTGTSASINLTAGGGIIPAGGIAVGACITVPITLTLNAGAGPNDIINYAEITDGMDTTGLTAADDIDSDPGSDSAGENMVMPGDPDDDNLNGAGPGAGEDEDDHDPATIPLFDLALIKTTNTAGPFTIGTPVIFDIEVINQGNQTVSDIDVIDYIPCGYTFGNNPSWTYNAGASNAITNIAGPLAPGASTTVSIELLVAACAQMDAWLNFAEIESFDDAGGNPQDDVDSDPDGTNNDPVGGDDVTDGTNGDEDDHDPEDIDIFDLALIKTLPVGGTYETGDLLTFDITVINQGNITANNIEITDYIQCGFMWPGTGNAAWTYDAVSNTAVTTIAGPIAPGGSTTISISLILEDCVTGVWENFAEISDDGPETDVDSNPDDTDGNDNYDDDVTDNTNDDEDDHDGEVVDVFVCPDIIVTATGDVICNGESGMIAVTNTTGGVMPYTYLWNTGDMTASATVTPTTTTNYTVVVTDADGCTGEAMVTVVVNPLPACNATNTSPVCEGESFEIMETGGDAVSWSWTGPNGFTSTLQNITIANSTLADAGTYTVVVTDANGCMSTCSTVVTIEALELVCSVIDITVNLDVNGQVTITPDDINNGSSGGCGGTTSFEIDIDQFFCNDMGDNEVKFTVSSSNGQDTCCTAIVTVVDDMPPVIVNCPADLDIDCEVFTGVLTDYGDVTQNDVDDNCSPVMTIEETNMSTLNACNIGSVIRTWTVTDNSGNSVMCSQTITVGGNVTELVESDIVWPMTPLTLTDCNSIDPDSLMSFPVVNFTNACGTISIDYVDDVAMPMCTDTIVRTWTIVDSCFDNTFTFDQTIFLEDDSPPVCFAPADFEVYAPDTDPDIDNCSDVFVNIVADATDCSGIATVTNDSPFADDNNSLDASGTYESGVYVITWTITDVCGNVTTCSTELTVVSYAIRCGKLFIDLMDTDTLKLDINLFQQEVYDCGVQIDVTSSLSPTDPLDSLLCLTCDDLGITFYTLYAHYNGIVIDTCAAELALSDPFMVCPTNIGDEGDIFGRALTEDGEPIQEVEIELEGSNMPMLTTDVLGSYAFPDMPLGGAYTITAGKDIDPLNGVSTLDLILIQRHIVGLDILDSPYKIIAADINRSDDVTGIDIVELRKMILGIYPTFPSNTSWRMIDEDHIFPDPVDPFSGPAIPEEYNIYDFNNSMGVDFIGVKVGDVNGSALLNLENEIEVANRSLQPVELLASSNDKGLEFNVNPINALMGFQFTLEFNPAKTSVQDVRFSEEFVEESGFHVGDGFITISWNNIEGMDVEELEKFFEVDYTTTEQEAPFVLSSLVTEAEAYVEGREADLSLDFILDKTDETVVFQNVPNPWSTSTEIRFYLAQDEQVQLSLYNVAGKLIYNTSGRYTRGINSIEIGRSLISESGVIYYKVEAGDYTETRRMLIIN